MPMLGGSTSGIFLVQVADEKKEVTAPSRAPGSSSQAIPSLTGKMRSSLIRSAIVLFSSADSFFQMLPLTPVFRYNPRHSGGKSWVRPEISEKTKDAQARKCGLFLMCFRWRRLRGAKSR